MYWPQNQHGMELLELPRGSPWFVPGKAINGRKGATGPPQAQANGPSDGLCSTHATPC